MLKIKKEKIKKNPVLKKTAATKNKTKNLPFKFTGQPLVASQNKDKNYEVELLFITKMRRGIHFSTTLVRINKLLDRKIAFLIVKDYIKVTCC